MCRSGPFRQNCAVRHARRSTISACLLASSHEAISRKHMHQSAAFVASVTNCGVPRENLIGAPFDERALEIAR
jgi:hypothetical protein